MNVPLESQIWSAQQCADYFGQSYNQFIRRTQYAAGFPKRCPIPGQPRWPAKAVTEWALRGESDSAPPESRQPAKADS